MTEEERKERRKEYMREYMKQYRSDPDRQRKQYESGRRRLMRMRGETIPYEQAGRPPKTNDDHK